MKLSKLVEDIDKSMSYNYLYDMLYYLYKNQVFSDIMFSYFTDSYCRISLTNDNFHSQYEFNFEKRYFEINHYYDFKKDDITFFKEIHDTAITLEFNTFSIDTIILDKDSNLPFLTSKYVKKGINFNSMLYVLNNFARKIK